MQKPDLSPSTDPFSYSSGYRPFIDGLRAVAVLAVVLYHGGVPGLANGFIGVDIFFVISGFLIIGQIASAIDRNTFSFADFWSRRALRILPPYLLVILCVSIAAPFVLVLPSEYKEFGLEVLYSAAMVVNHLFLEQQGYFDQSSDTKVLLHLWSLAVEEQFYLITPLLMVVGAALVRPAMRGPGLATAGAIGIGVASFAACIYWTDEAKNYAFYLMPLRAWEFVAGGAVALAVYRLRNARRPIPEALSIVGVLLIGATLSGFIPMQPFPSYTAAVPVVASCLILTGGLLQPRIFVARVLASAPMVWIGLISYAWYLWHWPLIAMARIYNFGQRSVALDLCMVALSFLLAVHTHLWIERPIRAWRNRKTGDLRWAPAAVGLLACAHVALPGIFFATWYADRTALTIPATLMPTRQYSARACQLGYLVNPDPCQAQLRGNRPGVIFGDSHAFSLYPELDRYAARSGGAFTTIVYGACAPMFDLRNFGRPESEQSDCIKRKLAGLEMLRSGDFKVEYAVIAARWGSYVPRGGSGASSVWALGALGAKAPDSNQQTTFINGLRRTIEDMKAAGVERIMVIAPVPEFVRDIPTCVTKADAYGIPREAICTRDRLNIVRDRAVAVDWLRKAVLRIENVRLIDPLEVFCDGKICRPYQGQVAFYRDSHHLSDSGVAELIRSNPDDFNWLVGGSNP